MCKYLFMDIGFINLVLAIVNSYLYCLNIVMYVTVPTRNIICICICVCVLHISKA